VQPEFREYERLSTTVLNAYLQPVLDRYLGDFAQGVAKTAPKAALGINQSSGGLMSVDRARHMPIRTALSGPAAGAVGAIHMARLSGVPDVISLDMGGTSADVALIRNYAAAQTSTNGSRAIRRGSPRWTSMRSAPAAARSRGSIVTG
jgi:N-methylhydantoinase A